MDPHNPVHPIHQDLKISNGLPRDPLAHGTINADPQQPGPETPSAEPIAVIGLAFELPGGLTTAEQLLDTVNNGRSHCCKIPQDRWNVDGFYDESVSKPGVHKVKSAYLLGRDIGTFDPAFFGITVNEARAMDPQQRILLETSYRAFENGLYPRARLIGHKLTYLAGLSLETISGSDTCVYVGTFVSDYLRIQARDQDFGSLYMATGTGTAIMANRLSWFFNLQGPSASVDTGCSASLLALHLACQSIRNNESTMGLVGGCNIILDPDTMVSMSESGFLSHDGKSHSFDDRANGYGRGEGSGVVIIKKLSRAIQDGDTIRAVIRATDANQDGFTPGITQPNPLAQKSLIQRTYRKANLELSKTRYFEAHGTGTPIGDPLEVRAIQETFGGVNTRTEGPLIVTALKPNIGHLENASGVASLIKTILCLENGVIPPIANLKTLNPAIHDDNGIKFATEAIAWPDCDIRRASINSFGYGGTNVHAVLDDAYHFLRSHGLSGRHSTVPHVPFQNGVNQLKADAEDKKAKLLVLSAADEGGIGRAAADLSSYVTNSSTVGTPSFVDDLSYTLSEKRSHHAWRSFVVVQPGESIEAKLQNVPTLTKSTAAAGIAFVFTGQGAQWPSMGQDLLSYQVFEDAMKESSQYFQELGSDWSLLHEIEQPEQGSRIHEAKISQPANTALQIALVELLRSWNILPVAAIGHSSGEIAAAYCNGSLSKRAALKIAYYRGLVADLASQLFEAPAGMLAIGLSEAAAQEKIQDLFGTDTSSKPSLACVNSPTNVTLSGYVRDLDHMSRALDKEGIFTRIVKTGVPYHSALMERVASIYQALIGNTGQSPNQESKCWFFSSTCPEKRMPEVDRAEYWVQNLVSPVRFLEGLTCMLEASQKPRIRKLGAFKPKAAVSQITHLIEIGPHPALKGPIRDILRQAGLTSTVAYASTLQRGEQGAKSLLQTIGYLFTRGYSVDLLAANGLGPDHDAHMLTDLPGYNFNHKARYWRESRRGGQYRGRKQGFHEFLGTPLEVTTTEEARWRQYINIDEDQWVNDHEILGVVIYPAAGLLVMALEAVRQVADTQLQVARFGFQNVNIGQALVIPSDQSNVEVQTALRYLPERHNDHLKWFNFTIRAFTGDAWFDCCQGDVAIEYEGPTNHVNKAASVSAEFRDCRQAQSRVSAELDRTSDPKDVYSQFSKLGFVYGPRFQALNSIHCGDSKQAMAKVDLLHWKQYVQKPSSHSHIIHPAVLDSVLQLALVAFNRGGKDPAPSMVPTKIAKLWITSKTSEELAQPVLSVWAQAERTGFRGAVAQFSALSFDSDLYMVEGSFELTLIGGQRPDLEQRLGLCYTVDWKPDISTMSPNEITSYCKPQLETAVLALYRAQSSVQNQVIQQAIFRCSEFVSRTEAFTGSREYLRQYAKFLGRKLENLGSDFEPCADWLHYLRTATKDLPSSNAELDLTIRVAENIQSILKGDVDPLAFLFADDLLAKYYSESVAAPRLHAGLASFVDLLGHKTPQLRILEIGAGTGGASQQVMDILSRNGDSNGDGPRFSHYCYTDISPSFFESARTRFSQFSDRVDYKVLNIEHDPATQGFEDDGGSFDVILAANVLHATSDLSQTLSHVNWLLKPGGNLILLENTQPDAFRPSFIFGLLPGWWLSKEPERQFCPLLTESGWHDALSKSGFTGVDMAIPDDESQPHQCISLIVSSKPKTVVPHPLRQSSVVVISSKDSRLQQLLAGNLDVVLTRTGVGPALHVNLEDDVWDIPSSSTCIFLPELEKNCTWKVSDALLARLQAAFTGASNIVWLVDAPLGTSNVLAGISLGLSRVYKSERPEINFVHLAVEVSRGAESITERISQILHELPSAPYEVFEDEYRETDGTLHINRIVPKTELDQTIWPTSYEGRNTLKPLRYDGGRHKTMTILEPGLLDSLSFVDDVRLLTPLGDDEIEIEVRATGLNFRDVLLALGQIDDHFFGFECAGIVLKTGSAVNNLQPGDRIVCLMQNTFATTGRCPAVSAVPLPDSLSMVEGAGLPVVAGTAYYALVDIARLAAGESTLIHSGAGGLGQAAIQIAQAHKAVIYTTVGTKEKKEFLIERYGIPEERIFSSRTLAFAFEIQRMTGGKGVDVVLNSLSGEALRASWRCVAPFGRFLETGKKDILSSGSLPLEMFSKNVSFTGIDLAHIIDKDPDLAGKLLRNIMSMVAKQEIFPPTPVQSFPISEVESAFHLLQSGKSMGKVVIECNDNDLVPTAPAKPRSWVFDPEACYVIAGGLGGLGRSTSRWMAARGARNLLLLSRRTSHTPDIEETLQHLRTLGVTAATPACDISDRDALKAVFTDHRYLGPIRGCIQLSMVIRESEFKDHTASSITESLRPKVDGTFNLHELLPHDLDFFVMFSSISGIIGTPGMAPYAMGNVFQDQFARWRVSQGLKATAIDLGIVSNVGYVAETDTLSSLRKIGFLGLTEVDIHALLAHFCDPSLPLSSPNEAQVICGLETLAATLARGAAGGPWYQRRQFNCINALRAMRNGSQAESDKSESKVNLVAALRVAKSRDEAVGLVLTALLGKLGTIFSIDQDGAETSKPLHSFGLDSLVAIEVRNWFRRFVGADVAVFEILGNTSTADLVGLAVDRSEHFKAVDDE